MASSVPDGDGDDGQSGILGSTPRDSRPWQQRFEDSDRGRTTISVLVSVIILLGIIWNLPASPISVDLQTLAAPIAAPTGLDQSWAVYAPPPDRVVAVEVDVKMANGDTRIWAMQPGAPGIGWWARWLVLRRYVIDDSSIRPQFAHWVVRHVVGPGERAVEVTVVLRTENLSKPGDSAGGKSSAGKTLYQETLAAPQ